MEWKATHRIEWPGKVELVMLCAGGAAFTKEEWDAPSPDTPCRYGFDSGTWYCRGYPLRKRARVEAIDVEGD